MPSLVTSHLKRRGSDDFVVFSKTIAQHLYDTQDGKMSDGLLAIVDCLLGYVPALGILKLERIRGTHADQVQIEGKYTFDLSTVQNLILHERYRLFKAAILQIENDTIVGMVRDNQIGRHSGSVASFFLTNFLGCMLREEPRVCTKRFYESAESFINELNVSGDLKARYAQHLVSELCSNRAHVSASRFAEEYLEEDHRMLFVRHIKQAHIPDAFVKDTSLISRHLRTMIMEFRHGVTISAKQEVFKEHVSITLENGLTKAVIVDEVKHVGGRNDN